MKIIEKSRDMYAMKKSESLFMPESRVSVSAVTLTNPRCVKAGV